MTNKTRALLLAVLAYVLGTAFWAMTLLPGTFAFMMPSEMDTLRLLSGTASFLATLCALASFHLHQLDHRTRRLMRQHR